MHLIPSCTASVGVFHGPSVLAVSCVSKINLSLIEKGVQEQV